MKTVLAALLSCTSIFPAASQEADTYYRKGLELGRSDKLEEAIDMFTKTIELQPENYFAWFNRGVMKSLIGWYEESLADFEQTIMLAPEYKNGWLNRGIAKKRLTDYAGAMEDFAQALKLDSNYADAYYNRGAIYELHRRMDSACWYFQRSMETGLEMGARKVEQCRNPDRNTARINPILRLTRTAKNKNYGFSKKDPIMVGTGPDGGPSNQRTYLSLLRDAQGKPVKYQRVASCCPYSTPNGLMSSAMLDMYSITYLDGKGKVQEAILYLSFYDYDEPMILYGFRTVAKK